MKKEYEVVIGKTTNGKDFVITLKKAIGMLEAMGGKIDFDYVLDRFNDDKEGTLLRIQDEFEEWLLE